MTVPARRGRAVRPGISTSLRTILQQDDQSDKPSGRVDCCPRNAERDYGAERLLSLTQRQFLLV